MTFYIPRHLRFNDMTVPSNLFESWSFVSRIVPRYALFYVRNNQAFIPENQWESDMKILCKKIKET